jgi:hypothetical protein
MSLPVGVLVSTVSPLKLACPKGELDLVFPTSTGRIIALNYIIEHGLIPAMVKTGATTDGKAKYAGMHALLCFVVHQQHQGRRTRPVP